MSTLHVRAETRILEARREGEDPRTRPASAWLLCDVTAPEAQEPGKSRRPVNVALVLDRSGSMAGPALELAKEGALRAVDALRDGDRFGLVVYDDRVDVLLESTPATAEARQRAADLLSAVRTGGSTDLHGGWLQGCEEIAREMTPEAESRCLLLTDGLANQGVKDPVAIARHAGELRQRGIVTSTFGLGDGFDEVLLQKMAEAGGGNAYWVRESAQIGPSMAAELGDSLEVVARGVHLAVEGHGVEEVLVPGVGRLPRGADGCFRRALGSLAAGQFRSEALHVRLRRRRPGRESAVSVWLEDADGLLPREERETSWSFQPQDVASAAPLDADVVVATRTALVQGLLMATLRSNDFDDLPGRIRTLDLQAERLSALATRVPGLLPVIDDLRDGAEKLADAKFLLDSHRVKEAFYQASYALKGRDAEGRARLSAGRLGIALDVLLCGDGVDLSETAALLEGRFRDRARGRIPVSVRWHDALQPTGPASAPLSEDDTDRILDLLGNGSLPGRVTIFVTPRPLETGFFSYSNLRRLAAVVSLAGLDAATSAPASAFLAYETVLHGLRACRAAWDPDVLMHEETRGCVFDLCQVRSDVDVKLHAASLCSDCREKLRRTRIDTGVVGALLSVVRDLSAAARVGVN